MKVRTRSLYHFGIIIYICSQIVLVPNSKHVRYSLLKCANHNFSFYVHIIMKTWWRTHKTCWFWHPLLIWPDQEDVPPLNHGPNNNNTSKSGQSRSQSRVWHLVVIQRPLNHCKSILMTIINQYISVLMSSIQTQCFKWSFTERV